MYLILQQEESEDFILATVITTIIRVIVK